jgi:hypothetical protein
MHKNYSQVAQIKEFKIDPLTETLNAILNYSKALKVEKIRKKKILININ